jgi:hypothetical protein
MANARQPGTTELLTDIFNPFARVKLRPTITETANRLNHAPPVRPTIAAPHRTSPAKLTDQKVRQLYNAER